MISSEFIEGLQEEDAEQLCRILNAYNLENDLTDEDIKDLTAMYFRSKFVVTRPCHLYHFEVAEILLLLRNGKDIQLTATIPQEGKKVIRINKDMNQELQKMFVDSLCKRFSLREEFEDEFYLSQLCERKKQLVKQIEKESKQKKFTKNLGEFVSVNTSSSFYFKPELFQKINKSKFYALCTDFLFYNEQLSSLFSPEEWKSKDIKEKYDIARKWVDSYLKQKNNKDSK